MTYKEFDMLFTGDISERIEKELVNISDCDVAKGGCIHGFKKFIVGRIP